MSSAFQIAMKEMGDLINQANLGQVAFDKAIEPVMSQLAEKAVKVTVENQFKDRAVNVKDFGAIGDGGVTDSTKAFVDAIAACPPGGQVIIPPAPNFYKVLLGSIVINKSISLVGHTSSDDQNGGDINSCRIAFFTNGTQKDAIKITASGVNLKNFLIYGTAALGSGHIGIKADSMINITVERVWIRGLDYGVKFDNCIQCTFRQVNVRDCVTGFRFETLGTSMLLEQCWVQNPSAYGYVFNNHAYCTLVNCLLDGAVGIPEAQPDNSIMLINCNTINIVGCASEKTKKSHLHFSGCEDITVSNYFGFNGNMIGAGNGHSFAFLQSSGKNIVFINPRDYQPAAGTVASITKGYTGGPPIIIGGNLPFGYNEQGTIIAVPNDSVLVGMAGIVENAFYLKASDTGVRKKLTVNGANAVSVVNG